MNKTPVYTEMWDIQWNIHYTDTNCSVSFIEFMVSAWICDVHNSKIMIIFSGNLEMEIWKDIPDFAICSWNLMNAFHDYCKRAVQIFNFKTVKEWQITLVTSFHTGSSTDFHCSCTNLNFVANSWNFYCTKFRVSSGGSRISPRWGRQLFRGCQHKNFGNIS